MKQDTLAPLPETPVGRYRHYKGGLYEVLGTARHSETLEAMTVYRALDGGQGLWVRPAAMFEQPIEVHGTVQPRFTWVGPATS
jgi:hypothetical protein